MCVCLLSRLPACIHYVCWRCNCYVMKVNSLADSNYNTNFHLYSRSLALATCCRFPTSDNICTITMHRAYNVQTSINVYTHRVKASSVLLLACSLARLFACCRVKQLERDEQAETIQFHFLLLLLLLLQHR